MSNNDTKLRIEGDKLLYGFNHVGRCYIEPTDGYYIFEPNSLPGQFNEYSLRLIADFLEELNKPWNEQIEKDLAKYNDDEGDVEW